MTCTTRIGYNDAGLFDEVFFIPTKANERERLERTLIRALHPSQNRVHRTDAGWEVAPMPPNERATDRRAPPRRAARRPVVQFDLFGQHRVHNRPLDLRRLTGIALGIWKSGRAVSGTVGEKFFVVRRLPVPLDASVVRWHPNLTFDGSTGPGLIFLLRDLRSGEPTGIVRLHLDEFGWPIGRKILGRRAGASISHAPQPGQRAASASRR